jgi:hypothetical protein
MLHGSDLSHLPHKPPVRTIEQERNNRGPDDPLSGPNKRHFTHSFQWQPSINCHFVSGNRPNNNLAPSPVAYRTKDGVHSQQQHNGPVIM